MSMILSSFCCVSVPWSRFFQVGTKLFLLSLIAANLASCSKPEDEATVKTVVQDPQRDREVRECMQRVQVATEHYAAAHGSDSYPQSVDNEFKSFFPGGEEGKKPAPIGPVNVYSGINEFPQPGNIPSVSLARNGQRISIAPGKILYCPLSTGKAYAILGGAGDGLALMDEKHPGQVLVLSNLEE